MQDFRKLKVWQKSHRLTMDVYRETAKFPRFELYGLTSQLRRSSVSIPSNIAEGCGKSRTADFSRFLTISMGSASELEYQLLLSKDLGYLSSNEYEHLSGMIVEIKKMLTRLNHTLKTNN